MRYFTYVLFLVAVLPIAACAPIEKKPSYADLVVIYNAEAETLERLERKRDDMVAKYEQTLSPTGEEALEALSGLIGGINNAAGNAPNLEATDPNERLDQAIATAENMNDQAEALIEAVKQSQSQPADRATIEAMYSDEFKAKLAELDAEIDAQRERVEKARAARDAAEAQ